MILAAGLGTRLGNLTKDVPKPMLYIAGKPVLQHIIDHLNSFGIIDIMIKVGYKKEVIMDYFGDSVVYFNSMDEEQDAIRKATPWFLDDYMLVQNGDTLTDIDISLLQKMGMGHGVRFMDWKDKKKYAGTKILTPNNLLGLDKKVVDCAMDAKWIDMGTIEGFEKAIMEYEDRS